MNPAATAASSSEPAGPRWRRLPMITAGLALAVSLTSLVFHLVFATHAGGLWRDEINSIGVATLPTLGDVWNHLQFGSYPILWMLLLRLLAGLGLAGDPALRTCGLLIGLGTIGAFWWAARAFRSPPPLVALVLFALSPSVIWWGDSNGAIGLGVLLIVITAGLIWRVAAAPTTGRTAAAALLAVASVQCHYYNSVLLFGLCVGGAAVAVRQRRWRGAGLVLGLGALAAVTMLPYLAVFARLGEFSMFFKGEPFGFHPFWNELNEALLPAGVWVIWLWVAVLGLALGVGLAAVVRPAAFRLSPDRRDVCLFALVALVTGGLAYYGFLLVLNYPTHPWYYLALLALVAVFSDVILAVALAAFPALRVGGLALAVVAAVGLAPKAGPAAALRLTNVDLLVAKLRTLVTAGDLVIVNPWYAGITYERYNDLPADWTTLPPISFHHYHRMDLLKMQMMVPDQTEPMRPVLEQIQRALAGGHRVYFTGGLHFLVPGQTLARLPPAPQRSTGWNDVPYMYAWMLQASILLQNHARQVSLVEVPVSYPVNPYENLTLVRVEGWRN